MSYLISGIGLRVIAELHGVLLVLRARLLILFLCGTHRQLDRGLLLQGRGKDLGLIRILHDVLKLIEFVIRVFQYHGLQFLVDFAIANYLMNFVRRTLSAAAQLYHGLRSLYVVKLYTLRVNAGLIAER